MSPKDPTDIDKIIGKNLKHYRELFAIPRHDFGKLIGVTPAQLNKYERGVNRLPASRLYFIATTLGIKLDEFFIDDRQ